MAFLSYGLLLGMLYGPCCAIEDKPMNPPTRIGRYEIIRRLSKR